MVYLNNTLPVLSIHPGWALLIGIAVLALTAWLFWPREGLIARIARGQLSTQRVLLEDALKFLFDCEYKNLGCRLNSVAGNLNISADDATRLLSRLKTMGLIRIDRDDFRLTDSGRSYALRVIRVHRIWERYLADETGIDQMDWHGHADLEEHRLTMEAANRLAEQIGNPVFDPHGDPIPSREGKLPKPKGQPLHTLPEGTIARITHIEDEPHAIYAQMVALGLYPGMEIYVIDVTEDKVEFVANGASCVLTPFFAANITVEVIPVRTTPDEKHEVLSSLRPGERARVIGLSSNCRGQQRRRLMDLGIVPGTEVTAELRSASGDPVAYQILGATIAIRKDQTDLIFIKKIDHEMQEDRPAPAAVPE